MRRPVLRLLRLTGEDADGEIAFATADALLAGTARQELWVPKRVKMGKEKPPSAKRALDI
jgi:hypothetical protein